MPETAATVWVEKPTKLISMIWPGATSKENLPLRSVIAPLVVSFTRMLAPIIGSPKSSTTVPVMYCVCAMAMLPPPFTNPGEPLANNTNNALASHDLIVLIHMLFES